MLEYGTPDTDTSVADALRKWLSDNKQEASYLLHHQRIPVDARPCKLPRSLKAQLVLVNGKVVTAFQSHPGAKVQITHT